jgi:hypothetical protein
MFKMTLYLYDRRLVSTVGIERYTSYMITLCQTHVLSLCVLFRVLNLNYMRYTKQVFLRVIRGNKQQEFKIVLIQFYRYFAI